MDLAPESPSDGGLAIFAAQQAIYRRIVAADYMSHRAFFGVLRDLLKARNASFSFLDLACGDAACTMRALRRTKVSDYLAVDLAEPALSAASSNARSLGALRRSCTGIFRSM
jgi:methylase of polypeptide subunit release factors